MRQEGEKIFVENSINVAFDNEVTEKDFHILENPNVIRSVPVQNKQQFYEELEEAVKKHTRYLNEIKLMPGSNKSKYYLFTKRCMDLTAGIAGSTLLLPFLPIAAIAIKLDSRGPVLYTQKRVGKDGRLFNIYKFRTMIEGAESKTGEVWATENDPRLTLVGRFLRKTKIDELPQFINLIKGDMSMVGPRPERPCFVEEFSNYIPGYRRRLDVIPGITGIAQLRNGYDKDAPKLIRKLRFDITYVKKMNLLLDLKLIAKTVIMSVRGKL